jgi:hypothetical protein
MPSASMGRVHASLLVALSAVLAGCGTERATLPTTCLGGAARVSDALKAAPGAVALADGTRLSTCLKRAQHDADLQQVGTIYTQVADALAVRVRRSDPAAVRLGYLIAAARRGARTTNGVAAELVRRLEQSAGLDGPPTAHRAAFEQGLRAGERTG